jgi:hypothetical protein
MNRVTINPNICHGKPTIRGSRLLVSTILEPLASGMIYDEVIRSLQKFRVRRYLCLLAWNMPFSSVISKVGLRNLTPTSS